MGKNNFDPNHSAHVVALQDVRPHPNADRLKLATVLGSTIVVGRDVVDGDIGLYFQSGLQINEEFARLNDLIRRKDPETGKPAGGMFDANCRVRTQSFRGSKSDGFFIELISLGRYGVDPLIYNNLDIGEYFETLDGKPICKKWFPKDSRGKSGTGPSGAKAAKKAKYPLFKEHFDTVQSRFVMDQFKLDDHVIITEKLHGTSQRMSNTLTKEPLTGIKKWIAKWLGFPEYIEKWVDVVGTRRVILDSLEKAESGFHTATLRQKAAEPFYGKLRKGESVYYEVVGYESADRPIMGRYSNDKVSKEFKKLYGKDTVFSYGTKPGESDIFVYRMSMTNTDGDVVDLPWNEVITRCEEIGVKPVPTITCKSIRELGRKGDVILGKGDQPLVDSLTAVFDEYATGNSWLDPSHVKEGICIRIEDMAKPKIFKHKGFEYKVLEGLIKPESVNEDVLEEL